MSREPVDREREADSDYVGLLEGVRFQPIFIMGDHRSGTTLLYQLLDATGCFNVVRAYHIVRYGEVIANHVNQREGIAKQSIANQLAAKGPGDRIIDGVKVGPDLPEEYGFVLGPAYRPRINERTLPKFSELCRKVQLISDPNRPLLLKNPWDFMQFMVVKRLFPEARFIFLVRHPLHVINSQIKAARSLYAQKSAYHALLDRGYDQLWTRPWRRRLILLLFSSHFNLGLRTATRHVTLVANYYLEHLPSLARTEYISVRYEDLCKEPGVTIAAILGFLGLRGCSTADRDAVIRMRPTSLLNEVERNKLSIVKRLQPYLAYCGYDVDSP